MIKILDSANETLCWLENAKDALITEAINQELTLSFAAPIDNKGEEVYHGHKVEVDDNYFNIMRTVESRTGQELIVTADCEHVSYDFIDVVYTAGYTATGLASAVLTALLLDVNTELGTSFTLGDVETTANETFSMNESTNARAVLMNIASIYAGELGFSKYEISLYKTRGADRGAQFRYRKNISDATVTKDYQNKDESGNPTITYAVNVAELEFEKNFINSGYGQAEHFELGDTVKVIDEGLNLNLTSRIVRHSYNPLQRMLGYVEIGDYQRDITNTIAQIKTTTVAKNNIYNGCSIGPDDGFVAERSDSISKTTMNATEGLTMQLKPTLTSSYTAVFYVQYDTATGTARLYLGGDAIFAGELAIGSGNNIVKADGDTGLWVGNAAYASAPFKVSLSGAVTASNLNMTGGSITAGDITVTADATIGNNLWLGASGSTAIKTIRYNLTASIYNLLDFAGSPPSGIGLSGSSIELNTTVLSAAAPLSMYGTYDFNPATNVLGLGADLSFNTATRTLSLLDTAGNLLRAVTIP